LAAELVPSLGARPSKAFGQARSPGSDAGHTRTTASSGEQRREFFRLRAAAPFQEASQRAGRPHRVAGIAGVVLELLQHLSWRVGSLGAPEIDEDLFAQLPAILGVSERGGRCMLRELVSERASAATAMRSMSTPRRGSATRGIRKVGKASPSRGPPSGHSERQPNLNVLYFPFSETTLH
jgi:hypothetical protein